MKPGLIYINIENILGEKKFGRNGSAMVVVVLAVIIGLVVVI